MPPAHPFVVLRVCCDRPGDVSHSWPRTYVRLGCVRVWGGGGGGEVGQICGASCSSSRRLVVYVYVE